MLDALRTGVKLLRKQSLKSMADAYGTTRYGKKKGRKQPPNHRLKEQRTQETTMTQPWVNLIKKKRCYIGK